MRTYVVIWDNGASKTIHGPWYGRAAADHWIGEKAREVWDNLFDEEPPVNRLYELRIDLKNRSGNSFTLAPVVPPNEQPTEEDILIECMNSI